MLNSETILFKRALLGKDKLIQEISKHRDQLQADLNACLLRVESTEKQNASLKYEVRVLEKELQIRHEEIDFNRQTADVAQKQQQDSAKRIAKLETECLRLRLLVRKRLPGPAALTRMKNEVKMLEKDRILASSVDRLHMMEEENRILKSALKNNLVQEQSALSDFGSDDKGSCYTESCASAMVPELEDFKNEKRLDTVSRRYMETSDMNLMDDFAEMEKLAVDSEDSSSIVGPSRTTEPLIPVQETNERHGLFDDLMKMLFDHSQAFKRSPHEVLDDMKVALVHNSSDTTPFNGKDEPLGLDASDKGNENEISTTEKTDQELESNVSTPAHKIIELLQGINVISTDDCKVSLSPCKNSATPTDYTVRVFQWRTAELVSILQQFVETCHDLLNGKANLEQFARLVASDLEWIMNHCFSIQDVSNMKDAIKNRLECHESRSESEVDTGSANVTEKAETEITQTESKESSTVNLEVESFRPQLEDSNKDITDNLETVKQFEGTTVDRTEIHETMNEDIVLQNENNNNLFTKTEETSNDLKIGLQSKLSNEVSDDEKPSTKQLQNDLELTAASEKLAECQETILNLSKQLKALASSKDAALFDKITSTSIPNPRMNASRRLSLLDKMLAEDNNNDQTSASLTTKDDDQIGNKNSGDSTKAAMVSRSKFADSKGIDHGDTDRNRVVSLAVVPVKKNEGTSLLKKLFWGKRKVKGKRTPFL